MVVRHDVTIFAEDDSTARSLLDGPALLIGLEVARPTEPTARRRHALCCADMDNRVQRFIRCHAETRGKS